jgi:hypothetical protein
LSLAKAREAAAAIMGDVAKGLNPATVRKEAAKAERAKRARDRVTLRVLIEEPDASCRSAGELCRGSGSRPALRVR